MKIKSVRQIYLFFLIGIVAVACRNKKDIDLSAIDLEIKIERFDKELSSLNPGNFKERLSSLENDYGVFYEDFMEGMLNIGNPASPQYLTNLNAVLQDKDFNALKEEVSSKFSDMKTQETELTNAFKRVKYYFPKQQVPRLISFFSGFTVQTPIGNNYIGIGLDMFLGADSKFYPALRASIPEYISRRFTPQNITPRVVETFLREDMFEEPDQATSLLDKMIYNGKILYCMDAMMPDVTDSLKIGYTKPQLDWAEKFEAGIWAYFLQENLLYETDYMKIQKFLTEAPFTPGIGERNESAPKLAVFTGWKIVKNYMERNPEVTLQELMQDNNFQGILNKAKYRPE